MNMKLGIVLFFAGLIVAFAAAAGIRVPGYMDASYYFSTAVQLAEGYGLSEPFIWNYLGDPAGIPTASHLYWMPLATFLSSIPMWFGPRTFRTAQMIFILMTALVPVLISSLAFFLSRSRRISIQAGVLGLLPGFFLPFFVTTDNFVIYALFGTGALWSMAYASEKSSDRLWFASGVLAGICHLARADGILFLIVGIFLLTIPSRSVRGLAWLFLGYCVVMAPWWLRTLSITGSLSGSTGSEMIWMTEYDQLFRYSSDRLTFSTWLESGFLEIIRIRVVAAWINFLSLITVNGLIILGPFMVIGAIKMKRHKLIHAAAVYLAILYVSMSFVFPLAGYRGSFFHSSAALMPLGWALAPIGFNHVLKWGVDRRDWEYRRATIMFGSTIIAAALILTGWQYWNRVIGPTSSDFLWESEDRFYREVAEELKTLGSEPGLIAVKDPPTFFAATGLSAVVIPYGSIDTLSVVVSRYNVQWILLDEDHPRGLRDLYIRPDSLEWLHESARFVNSEGQKVYLLKVMERVSDNEMPTD